jgi:hypothetical protein
MNVSFNAQHPALSGILGVYTLEMIGMEFLHMIERSWTILSPSFGWTVVAYKIYWENDPFIFARATRF